MSTPFVFQNPLLTKSDDRDRGAYSKFEGAMHKQTNADIRNGWCLTFCLVERHWETDFDSPIFFQNGMPLSLELQILVPS